MECSQVMNGYLPMVLGSQSPSCLLTPQNWPGWQCHPILSPILWKQKSKRTKGENELYRVGISGEDF